LIVRLTYPVGLPGLDEADPFACNRNWSVDKRRDLPRPRNGGAQQNYSGWVLGGTPDDRFCGEKDDCLEGGYLGDANCFDWNVGRFLIEGIVDVKLGFGILGFGSNFDDDPFQSVMLAPIVGNRWMTGSVILAAPLCKHWLSIKVPNSLSLGQRWRRGSRINTQGESYSSYAALTIPNPRNSAMLVPLIHISHAMGKTHEKSRICHNKEASLARRGPNPHSLFTFWQHKDQTWDPGVWVEVWNEFFLR